MPNFPHMCRDGHEPIGFANGPAESVESCPVCLLRTALQTIMEGGYAPGADIAHPAAALARNTLDPHWRERAARHYPKL